MTTSRCRVVDAIADLVGKRGCRASCCAGVGQLTADPDSHAFHTDSALPEVTSLPWRTSGSRSRRMSPRSRSTISRIAHRQVAQTGVSDTLSKSRRAGRARPSRSAKRRSSAGAIGRFRRSTKDTTIRRSRKNRCAARVAGSLSMPNTWMSGIFRVGVRPRGAGMAASVSHAATGYHRPTTGGTRVTVWFTVQLADRPGRSPASRPRSAERNVNITGIVGVAEDTDGALMLTTSDAAATRAGLREPRARLRGARPDRRAGAGVDDRRRHATRRGRSRLARLTGDRRAMPRRQARQTAAIRFDIVDGPSATPPSPRRRRRSAAASGRWRRSGRSTATRRWSRSSSRSRASPRTRSSRRSRASTDVRADPPDAGARHGLRQADHRRRRRRPGRPGRARRGQRGRPPQPPRRADLGRHDPARRRAGHRGRGPRRGRPAACPAARPGRLDHGRRHQRGRRRAARGRHPDHRAEHGRLHHRARGPRRVRSGPGRHDGRHGRRRHRDVRPRTPARPAVLRTPAMRIATWNVNSLKARQEAVEKWLERAEPDILLMQETKLGDEDAPVMAVPDGRLPARPSRRGSLERRRDRGARRAHRSTTSSRTSATGRCATAAPGRRGLAARTTSTRSTRPGCWPRSSSGVRFVAGLRAQRPRRRLAVLRGQAALVRAARVAGSTRARSPDEALRPGGRLQRDAGRRGRLGPGQGARRHARVGAGAGGARAAARLGSHGRVPARTSERGGRFSWWDYRAGMFHENDGHAHRPAVRDGVGREPGGVGGDRPRGAQGPAGPVRSRAGGRRPRLAGEAIRGRLGGGARADQGSDASPVPGRARPRCATRKSAAHAEAAGHRPVAEAETACAGSHGPNVGSPPDDGPQRRLGGDPPHRPGEALRRRPGGRRRDARRPDRRVLLAPRPVRLRQDHDPADDRRLRAADGGPDPAPRPRRHRRPARQAPGQHGLPAATPSSRTSTWRPTSASGCDAASVARTEIARRVGEVLELVRLRGLRAAQAVRSCRAASSSASRSPGRS